MMSKKAINEQEKEKIKEEFFLNNMFYCEEIEIYYTDDENEIQENIKNIKKNIYELDASELLTSVNTLIKHDYFLHLIAHVVNGKDGNELNEGFLNRLIKDYDRINTFFNKEGDNAYKIIELYDAVIEKNYNDEYILNDDIVETIIKNNGYDTTSKEQKDQITEIIKETWENKKEILTPETLNEYSEKRNGINFKYFLFCEEYIKTGKVTEVAKNLKIGRRTCYDYLEKKEVQDYLKERQNEIKEENTELMKQRFNKCFDTLYDLGVEHTTYIRDDIQLKAIDIFLKHYEICVLNQKNASTNE